MTEIISYLLFVTYHVLVCAWVKFLRHCCEAVYMFESLQGLICD